MICRLRQAPDPDLLTTAIGVWLADRVTTGTASRRRGIGWTTRPWADPVPPTAADHMMSACDRATGVDLVSTDVDGKTNEVTCLAGVTNIDAVNRLHARDSTRALALLG